MEGDVAFLPIKLRAVAPGEAQDMIGSSIEGSTISVLIEDVRKARDEGGISQVDLERCLEPADFELLEADISPAKWYPIESYRRPALERHSRASRPDRIPNDSRSGSDRQVLTRRRRAR